MARFLDLACLTYRDDGPDRWRAAQELLGQHPDLPRRDELPRRRPADTGERHRARELRDRRFMKIVSLAPEVL